MDAATQGRVKKRQRIVPVDKQKGRKGMLERPDCLIELCFQFGVFEFFHQLCRRGFFPAYLDNFVEDLVLVVLDYAPVIGKRSDTETMVLALSSLEKYFSVRSEQVDQTRGSIMRAIERFLSKLVALACVSLAPDCAQSVNFRHLLTVGAAIS